MPFHVIHTSLSFFVITKVGCNADYKGCCLCTASVMVKHFLTGCVCTDSQDSKPQIAVQSTLFSGYRGNFTGQATTNGHGFYNRTEMC